MAEQTHIIKYEGSIKDLVTLPYRIAHGNNKAGDIIKKINDGAKAYEK